MKKICKTRIITWVLTAACFITTAQPAFAKITYVDADDYASIAQNFTKLDLKPFANRAFKDDVANDGKGGWGDGGPNNDLSDFTLFGAQEFCGIPFDVIDPDTNNDNACVTLRGQNDQNVPQSIDVPVGQKVGGVYFLHAGSWLEERVGQYVFCYADGSEAEIEIIGKRDIADWWGTTETDVLRTAWIGSAPDAGTVSLGVFAMENPNPDKEVKSLRLQTYGDASYVHLVAVTVTDTAPYLPKIEENTEMNPDTSDWWEYSYPKNYEEITGTAMDVSFLLDAPAGKHGFAVADGEHFVFEDGTTERFWGVNVDGTDLYPTYKQSEYTAMILAQRGVNLVRMHMYDVPHGERNIFGWQDINMDNLTLDPEMLDRFHYFVYQMKERGIYAFIDVCGGRQSMSGNGTRDANSLSNGLKSAVFYDDDLQELQKRATEQLMGSMNPYTGLRGCEDPMFLVVNLNNESNIYNDEFSSEYYRGIATEKYNRWLQEKYPTRADLEKAWNDGGTALLDTEDQFRGTVKIYGTSGRAQLSGQRSRDNIQFLADQMVAYQEEMIAHYRSIGGKQLISGSTIWGENVSAFNHALTTSDVMDYHAYFLHPSGTNGIDIGTKLPAAPHSWTEDPNIGIINYMAGVRIKGMPYTISEWNSCEPNPFISEAPLLMAAYGGMNNWAPMQYTTSGSDSFSIEYRNSDKPVNYRNRFTGPDSPHVFDTMPAAAVAFHSVTESEAGYYEPRDEINYFDKSQQTVSSSTNAFLIAKSGIADRSVDNTQTGYENLVLKAEKDAKEKNRYASLTDELLMDTENRLFEINTKRSQGATGYIGGHTLELDDIILETTTKYATVVLSSLSKDEAIYETDRLLFTAAAKGRKTGLTLSNDGSQVTYGGSAPTLVEPVRGTFTLKTDANVRIWALSPQGKRIKELPVTKTETGSVFVLNGTEEALNFEIEKIGGSKQPNAKVSFNPYQEVPLFTDVDAADTKEIERVTLVGAMRGTSETTFSPDSAITRGDFLTAIIEAKGYNQFGDVESFADVDKSQNCYNSVLAARAYRIVFGAGDGNFYPNELITAEEANMILQRVGEEPVLTGDSVLRKTTAKIAYSIIVS